MTRFELLQLVIARARANGFEFRRWYTSRLGLPWISPEAAITLLDQQRRYYALLFSHEFASSFWKPGSEITFEIPAQSFQRPMPDGTLRTVQRKAFIRRSARPDAWRYHLGQMALAEDPLRHLRKYMHIEETLDPEPTPEPLPAGPQFPARAQAARSPKNGSKIGKTAARSTPKRPTSPRALPTEQPAFLLRPYKGALPQ